MCIGDCKSKYRIVFRYAAISENPDFENLGVFTQFQTLSCSGKIE